MQLTTCDDVGVEIFRLPTRFYDVGVEILSLQTADEMQ